MYAKLAADEAATITAGTDLGFLDERPVLKSVMDGVLAWGTGWRR